MGCSVCLWLVLSFCWVQGMGRRMRETVLGTLGKATVLWIPPDFQNLTRIYGTAAWKQDTEDPPNKDILLKYTSGHWVNYKEGENRFDPDSFSLEILNTKRKDQRLYEYVVSRDAKEKVWQIQLEVYEPVSDPSVQVLNWMLANSSCTVTLNCTAARGDNVSYSWASPEAGTSAPCTHNGSLLQLSYDPNNSSLACACTASNPVSRRTVTFHPSACSFQQQGSAGTGMELLVLKLVLPIVILTLLAGGFAAIYIGWSRKRSLLAEDSAVHTIYAQVQRVEKQKAPRSPPGTEHPSCTTIYAAATNVSLAPHSPQIQNLDTEPTTVYASVTMPMS